MSTPGETRAKATARRTVAKWMVFAGVAAAFVCFFVLFLEVQVVGASPTMFNNCGSIADPVAQSGAGGEACGHYLGQHATAAWISGGVAAALITAGAVVLVRTPR